jgi:hypothetical protein
VIAEIRKTNFSPLGGRYVTGVESLADLEPALPGGASVDQTAQLAEVDHEILRSVHLALRKRRDI